MSDSRVAITLLMQPVGTAIDPDIDPDKVAAVLNDHTRALRSRVEELEALNASQLDALRACVSAGEWIPAYLYLTHPQPTESETALD